MLKNSKQNEKKFRKNSEKKTNKPNKNRKT